MSITPPQVRPDQELCPALPAKGEGRGVHITELVKLSKSGRPVTCCRNCKVWFVE